MLLAAGIWMWLFVTEITQKRSANIAILFSHAVTHFIGLELTFAGLQAFRPHVINKSFYLTSPTILKPSATRSATTDSA